jgi:hypothetical protein
VAPLIGSLRGNCWHASGAGPELFVNTRVAYTRTNALLRHGQVWTAVKNIAAALLENETLTGREAAKIISAVGLSCKCSQFSGYYVAPRHARSVLRATARDWDKGMGVEPRY